jgi:hypothetical protein
MNKFIKNRLRRSLINESHGLVDFNSFPKEVKNTLDNEYSNYLNNFDWNSKSDEFDNPKDFSEWVDKHNSIQFLNNINELIKVTNEDIKTVKSRELSNHKLKGFEELIIPSMSKKILSPKLSTYISTILLSPSSTAKDIHNAFKNGENIIDKNGNIDHTKVTYSDYLSGDSINLPNFKRFVANNPEYKKVFEDWKKMLIQNTHLNSLELNAFRDTVSLVELTQLNEFLVNYRKGLSN